MFRIEFTPEAVDDLTALRTFDQRRVIAGIEVQLVHEPSRDTQSEAASANELAEWEFRVETFRIFYDVVAEDEVVKIVAVGYKEGNDLFVHGEKYEL